MTGFVHQALIYDDTDEFVATMAPFVRDGLDAGEPVLSVSTSRNNAALREALGPAGDTVDYRLSDEWYSSPGQAFTRWGAYLAARPDAERIRAIGELAIPVDWEEAVREWARYESIVNHAFATAPVWVVCPYDASALPEEIIASAHCTHPELHAHDAVRPSEAYVEPFEFWRRSGDHEPLARIRARDIDTDLAAVRAVVATEATRAGVTSDRLHTLLFATHEVAANALTHGGGKARLRTWPGEHSFVVEITDEGPGLGDSLAGYSVPTEIQERGRGLWLARQLCDLVEIRSGENGTSVRLHVRR